MLKPLGDRVVVKIEEEKEQTVGGFVLAGTHKEDTQIATVVAVSETGIRTLTGEVIPTDLTVGDKVVLAVGSGLTVKDGDETVTIVRESDVLAVLA
ncbi:hypothetical protein HMPREF9318_00961 [Streptococcus urinalis FB127-CNA-2]|uniref:Co-chaperonin GroES n=1 Tax=Streptococcus urinalis 2285-97 TaxID=764291 RepID=G5KGU5_9STRE|nr:co-chaperone GroES [Streptococcus urinalis]EHJ56295.1 chaperonin GroS [Streptococcus urinalis 2285-97]EKS21007.1 hypothetical protein HMPREF9318_00961 [Streptococcus urinalis FB127-CNA-2]VEF31016.1 co-chaperonin GroES [Streptococcus urinalis]